MYAPKLRETERSRDMIQEFRGYNHNLRIGDNEFYDMKNMTGSYYPVLSPRGKRTFGGPVKTKFFGFFAKDKLIYVKQNEGEATNLTYGKVIAVQNTDAPRQFANMGKQLLVVPEWKMYSFDETAKKIKESDKKFSFNLKDNVFFSAVGENGNSLSIYGAYKALPTATSDLENCLCVLTSPLPDNKPKIYECVRNLDLGEPTDTFSWQYLGTPALSVRITGELMNHFLRLVTRSDTEETISIERVFINDIAIDGKSILFGNSNNGFAVSSTNIVRDSFGKIEYCELLLTDTCYNYFVRKSNDNPRMIESFLYEPDRGTILLEVEEDEYTKMFPKYDYILENGNRIWTCFCGEEYDGQFVNRIMVSALGNFKDWCSSSALADGSYYAQFGSDGPFTGAIVYQGHPIFFKENCYHIVYGSYPANYQIMTENGYGVQAGSDKSLCIIDSVLYYKAPDGVYRFDGASHQKISDDLGFERYKDAVGGTVDGKYYIAMTDENGTRSLFVYDTRRGIWHKEDDVNVLYFASYDGDLYFVEQIDNEQQRIGTIRGAELTTKEDDVEWFVETGIMGYSTPDSKYVGKLQVRLMLPIGSRVNFYIEYDSDGYMEFVGGLEGTSLQSFTLPILPRRCDHFKIRIEGVGECKIFSLCKVLEDGGES